MKDIHYQVYLRAREYWNSRFNDIHVPLAYLHGRDLLLAYPDADPDIVIPSILLHDVGWKSIPEDQQGRAYGPNVEDESLLRLHELEGVRIANEILTATNYDAKKTAAILGIIDGHDSRKNSISLEDSVVKDADKIWRCTAVGVDYHHRQFGKTLEEHVPWVVRQVDHWFFTERGRQMAREAITKVEHALLEVGHV